jgi:hypothetical protein
MNQDNREMNMIRFQLPRRYVPENYGPSGVGFESGLPRPRSGQSTFESLLLLAAAGVLLLGLLVFAGNSPAGGATLLGRTRELVCRVLAGG